MAGRLVTIAQKQTYSFTLAASASTLVYLGPRVIMTPECVSGILLVRVSAITMASGSVKIGLANSMLMPDDPGSLYLAGSSDPLITVAEASVAYNDTITTPGRLYPKAWTSGCGAMLTGYMSVNQGGTGGTTTITCAIEAVFRDN